MSSSAGTKVTTDPESRRNPVNEGPGTITSDSLAAESLSSGGAFAAGNPSAGAMGQSSRGTTTNTTDTSSATRLDPAPDAESRDAQQGWSEEAQLNTGRGQGKEAGVGPTYATAAAGGRSSADESGSGIGGGSTGAGGQDVDIGGGVSASRAGVTDRETGGAISGMSKPHGTNVTEGSSDDFEGAPNASFNNDVGGPNDPGRLGEAKIQRELAESGADAGGGPRQSGVDGQNLYDTVGETDA
ncbi:MAG: hypothetical protein M1821_007120 [Bathelium mastoideum]|nr:MAG: hypothetical protein M1821_007120 [Bathelium mastoideum]